MKPAARLALRHRLAAHAFPPLPGAESAGLFLYRKAMDTQAAICYARGKEREKN